MKSRLGLVVNPIAGIGGPVGLKGSDGAEVQSRALAMGGTPAAAARVAAAVRGFAGTEMEIVTAGGAMGEDICCDLGVPHAVVVRFGARTSGADTRAAVIAMAETGTDLILFAGGDGTARDVLAAAGRRPLLGIPAGVKMYSGVFAASPALAGWLAARFLAAAPADRRTREVEILDVDEASPSRGAAAIRLHGTAVVPASPAVPRAKASLPVDDDRHLRALCRDLARRLEPECLYVVGPGQTTRLFITACGLPKTLLGVDAMRNGAIVAADCGERDILALLDGRPARIVVGLLGAQGCLFGRGNQPISARVLRRVGLDRILVLAGAAKVASLTHGLFADTGDPTLDRRLEGFLPVHTGPGRSTLLRVRAPQGLTAPEFF